MNPNSVDPRVAPLATLSLVQISLSTEKPHTKFYLYILKMSRVTVCLQRESSVAVDGGQGEP